MINGCYHMKKKSSTKDLGLSSNESLFSNNKSIFMAIFVILLIVLCLTECCQSLKLSNNYGICYIY